MVAQAKRFMEADGVALSLRIPAIVITQIAPS
jgi:hypothetical protein